MTGMELIIWTLGLISTTSRRHPTLPQEQLEAGILASQSWLPSFLWVSFRLNLTSFLPPKSRYENLKERNSLTCGNQCCLGSVSLGAEPMKGLCVQVIYNESALMGKGTREQEAEGERNQTRVRFQASFQLQPDFVGSYRVQMVLRVCPDTGQVWALSNSHTS